MKKKILLLTNLKNGDPEEDLFLSDYLKNYFDVTLCHPLHCENLEKEADLILIRNIWPTETYITQLDEIFQRLDKKGIKIYPSLSGKGDMKGKKYLVELFNDGFPVIPTIDNEDNLNKLGNNEYYFVKPVYGGSSVGCKKVTKRELLSLNVEEQVIQPFVEIESELSFYFLDNKFQHALYTPDKTKRWNLKPFTPTKAELEFAQKFVKWNALPYGLQRIDACRTKDGKLLLVEVEDLCPFLSLLDIDVKLREKFLKNLVKSLKKVLD